MRIKNKYWAVILIFTLIACDEGANSDSSTQGTGGSLSRFAISLNHLYLASGSSITVYNISQNKFESIKEIPITFGLETIQTNGDYLYLGARDAMYIYSIANRASPEFVFRYSHIVSCDPVVVQGNRAYVTLRSGNTCNQGSNALEILDISNPNNPQLITQYAMTSPGGLGIYGTCLFVCEGTHGMKMLSVAGDKVQLLKVITDVNAYDVIVQSEKLTLTGQDGIFQYKYDCSGSSLQLISKIPVTRVQL